MRIIINLDNVEDEQKQVAAIYAIKAAMEHRCNPEWCQGTVIRFHHGICCATSKIKTGFSVQVWEEVEIYDNTNTKRLAQSYGV